MSLIFNTKICPICGDKLKLSYSFNNEKGASTYMCENLPKLQSHYQVIYKPFGNNPGTTQRIYINKYLIINKLGSFVSLIYKCEDGINQKYIMEIPMIVPKNKEQFLNKIKLYVTFS